jgi:4-hydroxy-2-oxoheptanedioate aldolase
VRASGLQARFADGEPVYGSNLMFPSVQMVEVIGRLGFDWVLIDCEHGAISLESLDALAVAADAAGIAAIVRPPSNDPVAIARVLDRGVQGVQIPHIDTPDDARRAVAAAKYHPLGERGLAPGTRTSGYGLAFEPPEFVAQSNRDVLVVAQIEHKDAVANLEAIVAVEGIDVFFVGTTDLSLSLGHPGQFEVPVVRDAIDYCFETIRAAGKVAGSTGNAATLKRFRERGVLYAYTPLFALLADGANHFRAALAGE